VSGVISILITLGLGFGLQRASLCTVAAVQQWLVERRPDRQLAVGVAVCFSGVTLLGSAAFSPASGWLPATLAVTPSILLGGVLLGLGSALNGACFVGSVVRLTAGELNYGFSLLGLGFGLRVIEVYSVEAPPIEAAPPIAQAATLLAPITVFLVLGTGALAYGVQRAKSSGGQHAGARADLPWLVATGILAGLLFVRLPDWSYSAALAQLAAGQARLLWETPPWSTLALFVGAAWSARRAGHLAWRAPSWAAASLCTVGGFIMALGAGLVPGGNDTLLLWSIPGLALHAAVAYGIMVLTLAAVIHGHRRLVGGTVTAVAGRE